MPLRVTVFGGTGFLGRRVVRHLHDAGLVARVACRHPHAVPSLFSREVSDIEAVHADVNDDGSVPRAVAGAWASSTPSVFMSSAAKTHFMRSMWQPLSASRCLRTRPAQKHSCISPGSAPMRDRPLLTSVAAVRERRQFS